MCIRDSQSTTALGKMSFGILQTFLNRMKRYDMVDKLPEMATLYRQFQAEGNRYDLLEKSIIEYERPPMITIPEYCKKFGVNCQN